MWVWLIGLYAVFLLLVSAAAAGVALFVNDEGRREMALRVLKLTLGTGTGAAGLMGVVVKLYESGLM